MAVTINGDGVVDVGGNASSAAYVRLYEDSDNGTNYVDLIAPASVASNRTITLPDNTGTMLTSASSITASQLPAGSVLQVVSTVINATFSTTSTSFVDVTGLSVSITPSSASNKILVLYSGAVQNTGNTANTYATLLRGATNLAVTSDYFFVNSAGTRIIAGSAISFLDSPNTTSSTTYKIQSRVESGSTGLFFSNSSIIAMEIAA